MMNIHKIIIPVSAATAFTFSKFVLNRTLCHESKSPLSGHVILITGATSGIGEACAKRLAAHDIKLILLGRRQENLTNLKNEIQKDHPHLPIHTISLSVTDFDNVLNLPNTLPKEFSKVDVIINNAGLALGVSSVENNNIKDAETVINTNVTGTIAICSAFLPGMKERGRGHLVNMGSVAGHYAYATGSGVLETCQYISFLIIYISVYNASKYAIRGFTEAARHDLCGTPLRVTHISPGLVGGTEFSVVRLGDESKAKSG
jgi:3-hydroxy acid dehydrogenase/malonic semialdehyde reductase